MRNILERIRQQAVILEQNDAVHIFYNHFGEPASEEAILNAALPTELAELYRIHNGLVIAWTPKAHTQWEEDEPTECQDGFPIHDDIIDLDAGLSGCLFIPPLSPVDDSLLLLDTYDGSEGKMATRPKVLPFDIYSFFQGAAVCWAEEQSPVVIVGDDNYAEWEDHQSSTVETYLRLVSSKWFMVKARTDVLSEASDDETLASWDASESDVAEVIEEMLEDE